MSSISDVQATTLSVVRTAKPRGRPAGGNAWWRHALGILAILWALFPIVFLISAAINPAGSLQTSSLIPKSASMANFDTLFGDTARPYLSWYKNSLIISLVGALGSVFIGACAAYAFSRLRFIGRRPGLLGLLLLQMFPAMLTFPALYLTFSKLGDVVPALGLNSIWALILCYLGGAMGANVWLLKGYFDTIPKEIEEAARIDGAGRLQTFFVVMIPLALPAFAIVILFSFMNGWTEFILSWIFMVGQTQNYTLAMGLATMTGGTNTPPPDMQRFAAMAILISLPILVLFFAFQKWMVGGLSLGGVKG